MENNSLKKVPAEASVIGANIRKLRVERALSSRAVAKILGVSFQQIQKYESGRNRLAADKLYLLKNYFDVPYELFFAGIDFDDHLRGDIETDPSEDMEIHETYKILSKMKNHALKRKICKVVYILAN